MSHFLRLIKIKIKRTHTQENILSRLEKLLNQINITSPQEWFDQVCQELFYGSIFHVKNDRYQITEAELYLNSKEHPDAFTHGSMDQKKVGLFYFHKRGNSYQEGNIKGIDITFGNESRYGGILLRGMQNLDDRDDYIDGPGRLSQRIIEIFGGEKVVDVAPVLDINIFSSSDIWIEEKELSEQIIYKAPRKGLTLSKNVEARLPFFAKHYRYLAHPIKTKEGKELLSVALERAGHNTLEILGGRESTIKERMSLFEQGIDIDPKLSYKKKNENFHIQVYGELSRK